MSGLNHIAAVLPFANAVDAARAAVKGDYGAIPGKLWIVCVWAVVLLIAAVVIFAKKMKTK